MILKEIYKHPPASTLIEDTWQAKGRPLFLSLIRQYSELGFTVRYFKYDSPLSFEKADRDHFKFSWETSFVNSSEDEKMQLTSSSWSSECLSDQVIVAIDSLSVLLLNWSVEVVASLLGELLKSKKVSLIALVHGDSHDKQTLKVLNYIFSCHLTLKASQGRTMCRGIWRKTSGKIVDSDEYFKVTEQCELKDVLDASLSSSVSAVLPVKSAVPKSSFKLDLNAKEEEARSQVVLPYIRKQNDNGLSKGQIIYEAESLDWEDEDPDDDLEI